MFINLYLDRLLVLSLICSIEKIFQESSVEGMLLYRKINLVTTSALSIIPVNREGKCQRK